MIFCFYSRAREAHTKWIENLSLLEKKTKRMMDATKEKRKKTKKKMKQKTLLKCVFDVFQCALCIDHSNGAHAYQSKRKQET